MQFWFIRKTSQKITLTSATLAGMTFPSYGQPNAHDTYLQQERAHKDTSVWYKPLCIHSCYLEKVKYNFQSLNQSMKHKYLNEKLKLYQMKTAGWSIFFLGHRTEIYSFMYAQRMSQVVRELRCSQASIWLAAHFHFCCISFWVVSFALPDPHKAFRGRNNLIPYANGSAIDGYKQLVTTPPYHIWFWWMGYLLSSFSLGMPWDKKKMWSQSVSQQLATLQSKEKNLKDTTKPPLFRLNAVLVQNLV